ncbi:MAG: hypothetical protein ABI778_12065 [Ignavibacteriota bacterium]
MRFNNYHQAIEVLRNREAEPPFEDIRTLVLSQKPSRKVLGFWFFISASVPILLVVYSLLSPKQIIPETASANSNQSSAHHELLAYASSPSPDNVHPHRLAHKLSLSQNNNELPPTMLLDLPDDKPTAISHKPSPKNDTAKATDHPQPAPENHPAVIESQRYAITEMQSQQIHYSIFIGVGMVLRSGEKFINNASGSIGAMMHLNNYSSLVLELRRNTFKQKNTISISHFRDTILKNSVGNNYHDTIRWLTSVESESLDNVFSVSAGYRFNFPALHSFSAFIEALAGISAQGGLASELAGIQYSFASGFSLELAFRTDQLFSRSLSPQGTFDLNTSISFAW